MNTIVQLAVDLFNLAGMTAIAYIIVRYFVLKYRSKRRQANREKYLADLYEEGAKPEPGPTQYGLSGMSLDYYQNLCSAAAQTREDIEDPVLQQEVIQHDIAKHERVVALRTKMAEIRVNGFDSAIGGNPIEVNPWDEYDEAARYAWDRGWSQGSPIGKAEWSANERKAREAAKG